MYDTLGTIAFIVIVVVAIYLYKRWWNNLSEEEQRKWRLCGLRSDRYSISIAVGKPSCSLLRQIMSSRLEKVVDDIRMAGKNHELKVKRSHFLEEVKQVTIETGENLGCTTAGSGSPCSYRGG